jgi:hypothetical protein
MGLWVRFGALLTDLNSPAVLLLLTVPRQAAPLFVPQMYVFVVSYCFDDTFVCSRVVFSSTVNIFLCPWSYFFNLPSPGLLSPSPVPFYFVGLLFNHVFVFFEFLISYKLFPFILSIICFLWIPYQLQIIYIFSDKPVRAFVLGPSGFLATGSCCWVVWGLRSLNATFPCWPCLSYF